MVDRRSPTISSLFGDLAVAAVIVVVIVIGGPAAGRAEVAVDLELVLAVDVSGSVDPEEARLQRDGYVQAFLDARVVEAIGAGFLGRIAVVYFEWAGFGYNRIVADWAVIDGADAARTFSAALADKPIVTARRTSISEALQFAVPLFDGNGFAARRRVIDISGDGANNFGRLVTQSRDEAVLAGITINGLPIVNDRPSRFGRPPMPDLDLYYRNCVIGGRSAFMVVADTFTDFARAIRRKLILEIAGQSPRRPASPVRLVAARQAPPCDAGERRWQGLIDDF